MNPVRLLRPGIPALGLLFALAACDEGTSPSPPDVPTEPAAVLISVQTNGFGTVDPVPASSFAVRFRGEDGSILREITGAFSEDPNRVFGPYEVSLEGVASGVVGAELEIAGQVGEDRVVIWSGQASNLSLTPGQQVQAEITLLRGPLELRDLSSLTITGMPTEIAIGESVALGASSSPEVSELVTSWGALDPEILSVDAQGRAYGLGEGTARVVAAAGPASDTVSVSVRPLVERIELSPPSHTFRSLGEELTLEATVFSFRGEILTDQEVIWSASPGGVVSVSAEGVVRAVGAGAAEITASVDEVSASIPVEVVQIPTRLVVTPSTVSMNPGEVVVFTGRVEDAGGSRIPGVPVTWESSDPSVVVVDSSGSATAVGLGTAEVLASADTLQDSARVEVVAGAVASLALVSGGGQIGDPGEPLPERIRVRALDAGGFPVSGLQVAWTPSDGGEAAPGLSTTGIDGTTEITWILGPASGTQTLTASAGEISVQITAQAAPPEPASVTISPAGATFGALGESLAFSAAVADSLGSPLPDAEVTWTILDPAVATVTAAGVVTAVAQGITSLVASAGPAADTVPISVDQEAASITVTPDGESIEPGENLQLTATVFDGEGNEIVGATVLWSSGDPAIASVDGNGLVTGESQGTVMIQASSGSATGSVEVIVTDPTPSSLEIVDGDGQTGPAGLQLGDSLQVRVLSAFGRAVPDVSVAWAPQNGGSASPTSSPSDASGIARTEWTLGTQTGTQELVASIPGDLITFQATAGGASRVFDRTLASDQVAVTSDPSGDFNFPDGDWTLAMWVRPDDLSAVSPEDFQFAFSGALSAFHTGVNVYLNPNLGMNWTISVRGASSGGIMPGGAPSTQGAWQHLVVRRTGTTVRLWSNGSEITTHELAVTEAVNASGTPRLGVRGDLSGEWYSGAVAHVTKWSSALSPAEIGALAGGLHALDVSSGTRDWFIPLGRDPETQVGGDFSLSVSGTTAGDSPPVDPPSTP